MSGVIEKVTPFGMKADVVVVVQKKVGVLWPEKSEKQGQGERVKMMMKMKVAMVVEVLMLLLL